MAFQTPLTVSQAVDRINRRQYVLPAIQREFIWKPEQIVRLFDSLMKGFPIGSFLFWQVKEQNKKNIQFYNFIQHYHERDQTHNPKADLSGKGEVTAVLDGQQRLTSLYIGLKGTYAEKKRYSRWENDNAFPPKHLYLCLTEPSTDPDLAYDFEFRTDTSDYTIGGNGTGWFRVGHALDFSKLTDVVNFLREHGLLADQYPQDTLAALFAGITERAIINYYVEDSQDLDKVLNIFIRVNSAGTVLSYSDLLLSMATAKWETLDAREEIHRLVDDVNKIGKGFLFDKDFVLKTCLMLGDFETRFATENFKSANMRKIEELWPNISAAVRTTIQLIAAFGFSGESLPSVNAVIPIVYYAFKRNNPAGLVQSSKFRDDRERIRQWLYVALLKRVFTGQPDTILRAVRDVLIKHSAAGFPSGRIADALRSKPRSMQFGDDEIDNILDEKYGGGYSFATLALLYPWLDFHHEFHQDHVHPKSRFTIAQLKRAGIVDSDAIDAFQERYDRIPNLQLLQGLPNEEKSDEAFREWLAREYPNTDKRHKEKRRAYMEQNYIPDVDLSLTNFLEFYEARRNLMRQQLRKVAGLA